MNRQDSRTKSKRRPYRSELRQKQAEATREIVLDGLERLLGDPKVFDFTMADVAEAAGVAPATVFRHFEGRQALFDALFERSAARFRVSPDLADSLDDLVDRIPALYAYYDEHAAMIRSFADAPALSKLVDTARRRRARRIRDLIAAHYPAWSPPELRAATAAIQLLGSVQTWRWFRDADIPNPVATSLAQTMLRTLLQNFEQHGPPRAAAER